MELLRKSLVTAFILVDRNIMTEALAEQLVFKTLLHSGVHSLDQLSTAQLISRIELCLPLLQREHFPQPLAVQCSQAKHLMELVGAVGT